MHDIELDRSIARWENSIHKYLEQYNKRKILVYGNDFYTLAISETATALGYDVVSPMFCTEGMGTFASDKMADYSPKDYFVFVASLTNHKEAYECLIRHNFEIHKDFSIMGIGGYTKPIDAIDSLLGFSRLCDDIPGFKIWDGISDRPFKIVILGNSTSDPTTAMLKSWPEFLFRRLHSEGWDVAVYNGATTGYCSTQEFLKLNRDVLTLKPDLVISFSGYNDIDGTSSVEMFPYLHKYSRKFYDFLKNNPKLAPDSMYMRNVNLISHGLQNVESDYSIWLSNMKKMRAICQIDSIKFMAFFQPILECEDITLDPVLDNVINEFYEKIGESREHIAKTNNYYCFKVQKAIKDYDFIYNLNGIFRGQKDVFYDICHYTEKGNSIISENVYQEVKNYLLERGIKHGKEID